MITTEIIFSFQNDTLKDWIFRCFRDGKIRFKQEKISVLIFLEEAKAHPIGLFRKLGEATGLLIKVVFVSLIFFPGGQASLMELAVVLIIVQSAS